MYVKIDKAVFDKAVSEFNWIMYLHALRGANFMRQRAYRKMEKGNVL